MSKAKALREALNQFAIVGTVKENNLEVRDDLKDKVTGAPYKAIMGDLVIKVGVDGEHRVKFFSKEMTKEGKVSQLFTSYNTVKDTYTSMADLAKMDEEEREGKYATRISVTGEIRSNDYSKDGIKVTETPELSGRFINSLKSEEEDKAEFDLEFFISSMAPEIDKEGIETGRLKVKAIVPAYGGKVIPIPLIITDEFGVADYMGMNFKVGDTIQVWGNVVNIAIHKPVTKSGFGQAKEEVVSTYTNEIVVVGGEEKPLEDEKAFDEEAIKSALAQREVYLEQKKTEGKSGGASKKTAGFGRVASKPSQPAKPAMGSEDIPF